MTATDLGAHLLGGTDPDEDEAALERYDFRRPSKFGREHVRSMEVAHEVFTRRFASGVGNVLRGMIQLEPLSADQVSYDDYIRSMPSPSVLSIVSLPPLPGAAILEMNVQFALVLVDRLLGGKGMPVGVRRPTELEGHLIRALMTNALSAFRDTLEPLVEVEPEISGIEYNPQLVQVAAPSDMVLLLTYRATVTQGKRAEGLLTLCYPFATLAPAMNRLVAHLWHEPALSLDGQAASAQAIRASLPDVDVELAVRLRESTITPRELLSLQPGDVIRLEHPLTEPVHAEIGGVPVFTGHLGRRGRRLAVQIQRWMTRPGTTEEVPQ